MLPATAEFDIPFLADDAVIECEAIDAEAGPPEEWPGWTDKHRFEPSQDDIRFLNDYHEPFEPSDQDWDDYTQWSGALTDDDIAAAGLAIG